MWRGLEVKLRTDFASNATWVRGKLEWAWESWSGLGWASIRGRLVFIIISSGVHVRHPPKVRRE